MSEKTRLMYRNLWLTHIKIEQQAEFIRQRLCSRSGFSIYDAFKAVDENDDGKITKDELRKMLERGSFSVTSQELDQLMDRYDRNGDGVITYMEFSEEIRPHSPSRKPIY